MPKARNAVARKKTPNGAKHRTKPEARAISGSISKKRFKASSGNYEEIAVLDANSATFTADLLKVFRENVAKAREENMLLFGSPDRVSEDR